MLRVSLVFSLLVFMGACSNASPPLTESIYGIEILEANKNDMDTMESFREQYENLGKLSKSNNGLEYLVESIDYMLGEGIAMERDEMILAEEKKSLPFLENALRSKTSCIGDRYKCSDPKYREFKLKQLIKFIQDGKKSVY